MIVYDQDGNKFQTHFTVNAPPAAAKIPVIVGTAASVYQFTPVVVQFPAGMDPAAATFTLSYSESNPNNDKTTGSGTEADPDVYTAAAGNLTLWLQDGASTLNYQDAASGGDLLNSGSNYKLSSISAANMISPGKYQFYVEVVNPSASYNANGAITVTFYQGSTVLSGTSVDTALKDSPSPPALWGRARPTSGGGSSTSSAASAAADSPNGLGDPGAMILAQAAASPSLPSNPTQQQINSDVTVQQVITDLKAGRITQEAAITAIVSRIEGATLRRNVVATRTGTPAVHWVMVPTPPPTPPSWLVAAPQHPGAVIQSILGNIGSILSLQAFSPAMLVDPLTGTTDGKNPDPKLVLPAGANRILITINGVANSPYDIKTLPLYIADNCPEFANELAIPVYNYSATLPIDLVHSVAYELTLGIDIMAIRAAQQISLAAQALEAKNPHLQWSIDVIAHSQGTMVFARALEYLSPEIRSRISYIGVEPQQLIPGKDLLICRNIVDPYDPVPWVNYLPNRGFNLPFLLMGGKIDSSYVGELGLEAHPIAGHWGDIEKAAEEEGR